MADPLNLPLLSQSILQTLAYYDIFNYPLKAGEVFRFLNLTNVSEADIEKELGALEAQGIIFQFNKFFSLQNTVENVTRRIAGNAEAEKYITLATRKARLIMRFPFVRSVMASGSLSKGYMDDKSDIDFFIVTKSGNLWIARTLLVLYKRLFLFNSHKHFCVNYFVDEDHLEIEEKNLFTATELATVLPLCGAGPYQKLHQANGWLKDFFPNYKPRPTAHILPSPVRGFKKIAETTISLLMGEWLNTAFMNLTLSRWKKLYQQHYSSADFQIAFKTRKYLSKNHPRHYQKKITELYQEKLRDVYNRLSIYQE